MAWRPYENLIAGELDNTKRGQVSGWLTFVGMDERVILDLSGDFHRDIRGAVVRLKNPTPTERGPGYMRGFSTLQSGEVGDMTAGLFPQDYVDYPYFEWYAENGRVVLELARSQVEVVGTPLHWVGEEPVSREQQVKQLVEFLGSAASALWARGEKTRGR